jgi:peptidoglycan hydrolase-like protein with peptidoglycan-binding domain
MSMAWGMGPSFATEGRWPNFRSACADRRWAEAADHCRFKPDESSIRHRNDKNQELFRTAARVVAENLDPTEIHTSLAASTGSGLPTLRQGDSSNRVLVLQHLLRAHSVDIAADGSFGPKTLAAVRVFQTRSGLTSDGVVGGNTWRALAVFALQTGSQGDAVKAAQICLGHTPPTGDFVEETTTAVEFFQADHGLPINGHVDAATWLALIGRK